MDDKARLRTILQLVGAGRRRIERAKEHCTKIKYPFNIECVLREIDKLEQDLKRYK